MNKSADTHPMSVQSIVDNLPAVVFEYTLFPDGTRDFTYLSPRCEEVIGLKRDILLNGTYPMKSFIHPEDREEFSRVSDESINTLSSLKWEGRLLMENGTSNWIEVSGVPVKMKDGRFVWSGIINDINIRKSLEASHRETERRHHDLLATLPLGVGIHQNGVLVYANQYAAKIMDADTPEELLGKSVIEFVHPEYRKFVGERMKLIAEGNPMPAVEEKFITLKGREIFVETSAAPFWFNGKPAVQLIVKDITEQKEAVQVIRKTETLFIQLFENSPLAIVMLDDKGNVSKVNHGFEEMFGYSLTELKGRGLNQFIVPDELENEGNDLNSIISNQKVVRTDTVRLSKNGNYLSVIIYGVPVMLEDKTIGIFGVYVDITERKKVEEELKIRNTELDNFVYKVSHDLRAPLSSVLGLVNLAMLPGNDDNLMDYLKIIGQKIGQLDNFINDVLSHSKNLKLEMKVAKVDFEKTIEQTFTNLNYQKGADKVKREVAVRADGFYNDPWRIAEIFRNLISNAIKYRKLDHESPAIHILVRADEKEAEIIFKDNGIGIDTDNLNHIFEMFYRASEQSDGSGLGLYIVKNAVDKLGGTIQVESTLGEGTEFRITLPNLPH